MHGMSRCCVKCATDFQLSFGQSTMVRQKSMSKTHGKRTDHFAEVPFVAGHLVCPWHSLFPFLFFWVMCPMGSQTSTLHNKSLSLNRSLSLALPFVLCTDDRARSEAR